MDLLSKNTLFVGKVAIHLDLVDSTNRFALDWISKNTPIEGTVIWADEQTAGRGQIGSRWESAKGQNIMASFILMPHFLLATQQFLLNQAIALAVRDWLIDLEMPAETVFVKWPNDIYVNNKKIAGILIENILKNTSIQYAVIGIGININQANISELFPNATSLSQEKNTFFEITQLLSNLCRFLERRYLQLKAGQLDILKTTYTQALFRYQELAAYKITSSNTTHWGKILGVSPYGKLILDIDNHLQEFGLKEIEFILS